MAPSNTHSMSPSTSRPPSTAGEPSSKRRMTTEQPPSLGDMPADMFISKMHMLFGAQATICVGGEDFKLPKELLCYGSTYFKAALTGGFKEGIEQKVTLGEDFSASTFQLAVQWLFQGKIVLPPIVAVKAEVAEPATPSSGSSKPTPAASNTPDQLMTPNTSNLTRYIDFLHLADYIELLGPFNSIHGHIRAILIKDRKCLTPALLRRLLLAQPGADIQTILVEALARYYIIWLLANTGGQPFDFQSEIEQFEGFAADLLRVCGRVMGAKRLGAKGKHVVVDPLSGKDFTISLV